MYVIFEHTFHRDSLPIYVHLEIQPPVPQKSPAPDLNPCHIFLIFLEDRLG